MAYGLHTACLNQTERRRLDGFQNRCLRKIWGIEPSFVSRVPNNAVLQLTGQSAVTKLLMRQQLLLYGKAFRAPPGSLLRDAVFCPGSLKPITERYIWRVGRPSREWAPIVQEAAMRATCSSHILMEQLASEQTWRRTVNQLYS